MEAIRPGLNRRYNAIHAFIEEIIREGVNSGEFKHDTGPNSVVTILFAAADGLVLHHATTMHPLIGPASGIPSWAWSSKESRQGDEYMRNTKFIEFLVNNPLLAALHIRYQRFERWLCRHFC
ncbi:hypothetical protein KAT55_04945 [Candidatus Bathyarchaeota archaeon]|nr:hypothetical protein [Candidatus Bathyarchaeota archaeon]